MEVYHIILLCLITGIVSRNHPPPEEKAICGDNYYFLNEKYNYSDSIQQCRDLGYDGLAVITRQEERDHVYDILRAESLTSSGKGVWLAHEYRGPTRSDWGWKRDGAWLNLTTQYVPDWDSHWSEPDGLPEQSCTRVYYNERGRWKSSFCSNSYFGICQKIDLPSYRESRMKVNLSNRQEPNGTQVKVRSFFECLLLCLDQCACKFTYHYGNTCYVLTGNDTVNTSSGLGTYYEKL